MAFTSADVDAIDTALRLLASGQRTAEVRFADGRAVKYQAANVDELLRIRALAQSSANGGDPGNQPGGVSYATWGCG